MINKYIKIIDKTINKSDISVDWDLLVNKLSKEKVMITGASGSIGSELVMMISKFRPKEILIADHSEFGIWSLANRIRKEFPQIRLHANVVNLQCKVELDEIFRCFGPSVVLHAAAYKHVPIMEEHPLQCIKNNIFATKFLADQSVQYNVKKFIFISTDKAVKPKSIMGASKRICEVYLQSLSSETQFITTRFGNVIGTSGSVIPFFIKSAIQNETIFVTNKNCSRYFISSEQAVNLVLNSYLTGSHGDIITLNMGNPIRILELANIITKICESSSVIRVGEGRPGDKESEELFYDLGMIEQSTANKVLCDLYRSPINDNILSDINHLEKLASKGNITELKDALWKLIYRDQNNQKNICNCHDDDLLENCVAL